MSGTTGVAAWGLSAVGASAVVGMGWATQTVDVPIVWLLVLTFVPTRDITEFARRIMDSIVTRVDGGGKR